MRSDYRRRIIASAMLAFFILLVLVIGGIALFSSLWMEQNSDRKVQTLLNSQTDRETTSRVMGSSRPRRGNSVQYPFHDIRTDAEGQIISVVFHGFQEDEADVQALVDRLLKTGKETGRLEDYKFGLLQEEGGCHIILMDLRLQEETLNSILCGAVIIGVILSLLLLFILFPVSWKAADILMRNTEKQKRFITDAGHELKTPVAVIRSNLDVMELLQGQNNWSRNIRGQVDRLERLVEQLLLLARLDESRWSGKIEKIDLTHALAEEMGIYQETVEQKKILLETDIRKDLYVMGDQDALSKMIHALMDNAMQYTPAGGKVWVTAVREKKQVCLEVTNTVEKLPRLPPEQLMDRFTRGDMSRSRKNGGTGIGLSTVRSVAEMMHGSVSVSYPADSLFQVKIRLPFRE